MDGRRLIEGAGSALLDERRPLDLDELRTLAEVSSDQIPALAATAHQVRLAYCGPEVEVEGILSAKTAAVLQGITRSSAPKATSRCADARI